MDAASGAGLALMTFEDGASWWLELGAFDRLSREDPAAVGRRYLAANLPELAAGALAAVDRDGLTPWERVLLAELGVEPASGLASAGLGPGSAEAWVALLTTR